MERLNELTKGVPTVFSANIDPKIETLAQQHFAQLNSKKRIPKSVHPTQEYENIDLKSLKNKDIKEVGAKSKSSNAVNRMKRV